jgi:hypothetical protein
MAGAYTAKPAAVVPVDYPPDWNIDWSFPGPFPPGFDPDSYEWDGEGEPSEADPSSGKGNVSIVLFAESPGYTTETGGTTRLGVFLKRVGGSLTGAPAAITVPIQTLSGSNEISYSPASVTFGSKEYGKIHWIELTGNPDGLDDGDFTEGFIAGPSTCSDDDYTGLSSGLVEVINKDGNTTTFYTCSAKPFCIASSGMCAGSGLFCDLMPAQLCDDSGYAVCDPTPAGIPLSTLIDGVQVWTPDSDVYAGNWTIYYTDSSDVDPTYHHDFAYGVVDRYGVAHYTGAEKYIAPFVIDGMISKVCTCACVKIDTETWPYWCCLEWDITTTTTVLTPPVGRQVVYYLRVYW